MTETTVKAAASQTDGLTASRYIQLLLDLLQQRQADSQALVSDAGLDPASLAGSGGWITAAQLSALLASAEKISGDAHLGLALGRQLNLSAHGSAGFAGLTAANAREAIQVAVDYFPLVTGLLRLQTREDDSHLVIEIHPAADLDDRCERFLVETLISSIDLMTTFMLGQHRPAFRIELAFAGNEAVRSALGPAITQLQFRCPCHAIHVPAHLLDIPFALADSQAHRQALLRCDRELQSLQRQRRFAARLLDQLLSGDQALPSIEDIAAAMHVSSRTVHRRLKEEGTGFRALVNEARVIRARWLMLRERRSVTETAYLLGYQDSANFTRAFRRQTGLSPSEYLNRHRS